MKKTIPLTGILSVYICIIGILILLMLYYVHPHRQMKISNTTKGTTNTKVRVTIIEGAFLVRITS
jgi:hypothetical protein